MKNTMIPLRRALAVFSAAALVFALFAGIPVRASSYNTYSCTLTLDITNLGHDNGDNYLFLECVDQRNSTYTTEYRNLPDINGFYTFTLSLPGVPKRIVCQYESDLGTNAQSAADWCVTEVSVRNQMTGELMRLWKGRFGLQTSSALFARKNAQATMTLPASGCPIAFGFSGDHKDTYQLTESAVDDVTPKLTAYDTGFGSRVYDLIVPVGSGVNSVTLPDGDPRDQYGCPWYDPVFTYELQGQYPGITVSGNTVTATGEANARQDYDVKMQQNYLFVHGDIRIRVHVFRYTVHFIDEDGSLLYVQDNIPYGDPAHIPFTPVKQSDEFSHYTFDGWDCLFIPKITGPNQFRIAEARYAAAPHVWGDEIVTRLPACTSDGEAKRECTVCGYEELRLIPAAGHSPVAVPGRAASCTQSGATDGTVCAACGETLTAPAQIPPAGHTDADNDGLCDVCGERVREMTFMERILSFFNRLLSLFNRLFGR